MTKHFLLSIGHADSKEQCCYCGHRDAVIYYSLDLRYRRAGKNSKETFDGYKPYCEHCCEHLALGMLRDCAAVRVGEKAATMAYIGAQNRATRRDIKTAEILIEILNNDMKNESDRKEYLKQFKLKMMSKPRCLSDREIQEEICRFSGIPVEHIKHIKLHGAGVELVKV